MQAVLFLTGLRCKLSAT